MTAASPTPVPGGKSTSAPAVTDVGRRTRPAFDLVLAITLVAAAMLRAPYLATPMVETHGWRQVETASIARSLYEERFNPFYPEVNWGGPSGYVESEFPLLPALAAAVYHVTGPDVRWGRAIVLIFSLAAVWATGAVGARLAGPGTGRAAALLVAASPASVYYGRAFQPDTPMIALALLALYGFVRHLQDGGRALILGGVALGLAILVKLPAILVLPALLVLCWEYRGRAALSDRRLWTALAVPLIVAVGWYVHAFTIFLDTGLTFGIVAHPAKTYPPTVAFGPWEPFDKWSTAALLTGPEFYTTILARLWTTHLTPIGFAGAAVGLLLWRRGPGRLAAATWLLTLIAFVLVAGHGHLAHDYYQLPLVPVAALFLGVTAAPLLDREWLARHVAPGTPGPAGAAAVIVVIVAASYYFSGVERSHFRAGRLDLGVIRAGQAIDRVLPDRDLLIVADEYGVTSPMLLYYSHADGWSFDVTDLSPQMIARLHDRGARYFATTVWTRIERDTPIVAQYLNQFEPVPLGRVPGGTRLVDLSRPVGSQAEEDTAVASESAGR